MSNTADFDTGEFRKTLGTFTTGVTIITTRAASGEMVGITANSFNSVSLEPPLVLWSLARTSRSLATFEQAEHWAVHILAEDQQALSSQFARSSEDKFAGVNVDSGIGGIPLLTGCTSLLQCKTEYTYEGGDHVIFVGRVLDFHRADKPPLVFMSGQYAFAAGQADFKLSDQEIRAGSATHFNDNALDYLLPRAHYQIYSRVRRHHQQHDLSDAQYFTMVSLVARDGRTRKQLNRLFGLTGHRIAAEDIAALAYRGLLTTDPGGDEQPIRLTDLGRELALMTIAESKAIEAEVLAHFDDREALLLKKLLKRLVQVTDIGLPGLWDDIQ